jgi:S-adenosylmethionine:tRNA ribosyltransferase-isomerase
MHEEYFEVDKKTIEELNDDSKQIISVGTTSLRTLESLYWLGVQLIKNGVNKNKILHLAQWENLELKSQIQISKKDALNALLEMMSLNNQQKLIGSTGICITPGYEFKIVNALVTNFHQPQSTLLLIIAAILGDAWKKIYTHALNNDYRFLSYGDGCLLFIDDKK